MLHDAVKACVDRCKNYITPPISRIFGALKNPIFHPLRERIAEIPRPIAPQKRKISRRYPNEMDR